MLLRKSYDKIDGFDCSEVKCVLLVLHLDDVPPPSPFLSCNHCVVGSHRLMPSPLHEVHFQFVTFSPFQTISMCSCWGTKITLFTNQVMDKQNTGDHISPHPSLGALTPILLILIPKTHPNQITSPVVRQIARFYSMSVL